MNIRTLARCFVVTFSVLFVLSIAGCGSGGQEAAVEHVASPLPPSYEILDAYGDWVEVPLHGYVWRPRAVDTWQPYSYGHWQWTDRGWLWVGYEPYSWVVYHYGYWYNQPAMGWVWVPGSEWSPARVRWMGYGDYVGWAPMPPPGYAGVEQQEMFQSQTWILIQAANFTKDNVGRYRTQLPPISTGDRGSINVRHAPEVGTIERSTGKRIQPVKIETEKVRTGGRELERVRLTDDDARLVKQHQPEVERDALQPAPAGQQQAAPTDQKKIDTGKERGQEPKPAERIQKNRDGREERELQKKETELRKETRERPAIEVPAQRPPKEGKGTVPKEVRKDTKKVEKKQEVKPVKKAEKVEKKKEGSEGKEGEKKID